MRKISKEDETLSFKEKLFFEPSHCLDKQHIPSETIIFIQLREKKDIVFANENFIEIFGPIARYIGKEFRTWFSYIHEEYKGVIKNRIIAFFAYPCREGLRLNYPIIRRNQEWLLLDHKIYNCQFHEIGYMVNLISIKKRIGQKDYFFKKPFTSSSSRGSNEAVQISKREVEVLQLIANGYSSKQIADKLFISNHTVISHRKNLIEKFKVRNTAHLINKATNFLPMN